MRYKLVIGLAKVDQEKYPDVKDFDSAMDDAVTQCFMPIFSTFRIIKVEGNMMFIVIAESITEPAFIGTDKLHLCRCCGETDGERFPLGGLNLF